METEKQLYHPFTYPPICAQDYGRAPSLITDFSQARLGSDIRAGDNHTTAFAVSRILRIGIAPSPTLCAFFARLLSSSQSLDFYI